MNSPSTWRLHFGTLLSVLFYFRRTWFQIIRAALGGKVVRFSEAGGSDVNLHAQKSRKMNACSCGFWRWRRFPEPLRESCWNIPPKIISANTLS